ncbi:MAG: hypothetical protein QOF37_640 [Thermoleophilaceae bacterium]|nr:hypothetical protein [Thermoleophilaceae bacterium]
MHVRALLHRLRGRHGGYAALAACAALAAAASPAAAASRDPIASFSSSPTTVRVGDTVTFTGTATAGAAPITLEAWDVNNDNHWELVGNTTTRTFTAVGIYTVRFAVLDRDGHYDIATRAVQVFQPPAASFDFSPGKPGSGAPIAFNSTASPAPGATLASQKWDLDGDGQYDDATGAGASKTFAARGSYTVGLRVVDSNGLDAVVRRTVTVYAPPHAEFEFSQQSPLPGQDVTLDSSSTDVDGQIVAQAWDLNGDGNFDDATGDTVRHAFPAGHNVVRLQVTDSQGLTNVETKAIDVFPAPTASFDYSPATPQKLKPMTFTSTSAAAPGLTIASQSWNVDGDGLYDDGSGPTMTKAFVLPGPHKVGLRVVDSKGHVSVVERRFTVYLPPDASFDFSPAAPTADDQVTFTSTSSDADGQVAAESWDLNGDGTFGDALGTTAASSFGEGTHTVRLRVTDSQGLTATAERTVTVAAKPVVNDPVPASAPAAVIAYLPQQPHVGDTVTLNAGGADATSVEWDLNGDGTFTDAQGPSVTTSFGAPGAHAVAVRVTNAAGAQTTAFETINVLPAPSAITPASVLPWLSPFPIVRVAGSAGRGFTRISVFTVLTPLGTKVRVTCRGGGCPRGAVERRASGSGPLSLLRIRALERRFRPGARLEVSVTKPGFVGKFTRLVFQRLKPPARADSCIVPRHPHPMSCPAQR